MILICGVNETLNSFCFHLKFVTNVCAYMLYSESFGKETQLRAAILHNFC